MCGLCMGRSTRDCSLAATEADFPSGGPWFESDMVTYLRISHSERLESLVTHAAASRVWQVFSPGGGQPPKKSTHGNLAMGSTRSGSSRDNKMQSLVYGSFGIVCIDIPFNLGASTSIGLGDRPRTCGGSSPYGIPTRVLR